MVSDRRTGQVLHVLIVLVAVAVLTDESSSLGVTCTPSVCGCEMLRLLHVVPMYYNGGKSCELSLVEGHSYIPERRTYLHLVAIFLRQELAQAIQAILTVTHLETNLAQVAQRSHNSRHDVWCVNCGLRCSRRLVAIEDAAMDGQHAV